MWGFKDALKIYIIQHRTMRYYHEVRAFAPILGMQGNIGWHEPNIGRYIERIRFWNKLVKLDDSRLAKKALNADYEQYRNN